MKLGWLAVICALGLVASPACDPKKKDTKAHRDDDDDDDERPAKKTSASGSAAVGSASGSAKTSAVAVPAGDDDPPPPPAPTEMPKSPVTQAQIDEWVKDKTSKLSPEMYEGLLLAVADCGMKYGGVDYDCQAKKNYNAAVGRGVDDYKKRDAMALKHVRHPKPAVRMEAALHAANAAFGSNAGDGADKLYLDALRSEAEPEVLGRLISSARMGARKSAKVRKVIVRMIDHEKSKVREDAFRVLADRETAKEVQNFYDLVLAKVEKDPDNRVRKEACSALSATENESAVAVFKKYIEASDTPQDVRTGCFEGLVSAWVDYPYPKKPSKAAYELTMSILEKKDRSDAMPPWQGMSKLYYAQTEFNTYESAGKAWYAAASFFDKPRMVKAMTDIALDEKAYSLARSHALTTLQRLGEQKLLETLAGTIRKQSGRAAKTLADDAERLSKEKKRL